MPRISAILAACLLLLAGGSAAQDIRRQAVPVPDRWLQGFGRAVSGEPLIYPWAYPGQSRALLTRTTTGTMRIEWEAEPVPRGMADERVTYLWHAGMASGYGAHRFTLSVNGTACVSFTSGRSIEDREWAVTGTAGCELAFKTTRVGTFNELFGFMLLTVPRSRLGDAPPRFSVVGDAARNDDYYMVFQEPVRAWARATAEEARFKDGSRIVTVEVSRIGNPAPMTVKSGGEVLWRGVAAAGHSTAMVPVRGVGLDLPVVVEVDGAATLSQRVSLPPVRAWEIHLLPHSHVDIGYSDPQPEVERKQWKNLRDAVELAASTRALPPDARFKWNVEGLWSVESYLRQAAPAERSAFVAAVREGAIDLQANYTNILTGLSTPEELERWTDGARRLQAAYGVGPMRSAMHTDIPGLSWTVVRALAHGGVRYFSSGPNYMPGTPDGGDRIGRTLKALGDRPFWWQSPSGEEKLLFWVAGRGYSWFHGMNMGQLEVSGGQGFFEYLRELAADAYPYDMVQVRYTIGGDNGPVDPRLPGFVKAWNEKFDTPRLVIDTATGLFAEFERRYGSKLPTLGGDMTPYWEDGALSTAAEEALVRRAARRLQQAEAVFALRNPSGFRPDRVGEAWRDITLWHEHTWGAAASVSDPDRKDVADQWAYKREFARRAEAASRELLDAARGTDAAEVEALNTLSWTRSELVILEAKDPGRSRVVDGAGRVLPSQRLADGRLAVLAGPVGPLASMRLTVASGQAAPPPERAAATGTILDNGRIRVEIDAASGDIRSLRSTSAPGVELAAATGGLLGYRYVAGLDPNAAQAAGPARVVVEEPGPLVATLRVEHAAPGAVRLVRRVRVVAGDSRVFVEVLLDKKPVRDKESAHLAFPFSVGPSTIRVDQGEALVTLGDDQLPGSCLDFIGAHSAVDVSGEHAGIGLATLDAPLVEPWAMTDERRVDGLPRTWRTRPGSGATLYAYLLDNYWHTNYKADQEGELRFRFVLAPHGPFDPAALHRLGAETDQPLVLARASATTPVPAPFHLDGEAVVSAIRPTDDAMALTVRLYNPTPSATTAFLSRFWRNRTVTIVTPGTRRPLPADGTVALKPFGAAVLEIRRNEPGARTIR